jgi:Ca2+-binding RTX toxin-like protein
MALINGTIFNDNDTVDSTGILRPALVGDLRGVPEADTINGNRGDDIIRGLGGNDLLNGGDGVDLLDGGDGNDNVSGNKGDDTMLGGAGNDRLFWIDGDGSDNISGGTGVDTVTFTGASTVTRPNGARVPGDDILTLTRDPASDSVLLQRTNLTPVTLKIDTVENFEISGVEGNDILTVGSLIGSSVSSIRFSGGTGNDILDARNNGSATMSVFGDAGNDTLMAGNQSDRLEGGDGNDALFGGNGNDTLIGVNTGNLVNPGRGEVDVLVGGAARDLFVLGGRGVNNRALVFYDDGDLNFDGGNNVFTGMDGVSDFAHIVDFVPGLDRIQLVGSASEYVIRDVSGSLSRGSATQDVGIFKARPNLFAPDELVAIVQDVGSGRLNLTNGSQFTYV